MERRLSQQYDTPTTSYTMSLSLSIHIPGRRANDRVP